MASHPPQIPMPQALDIQDGEETLSSISPDPPVSDGETDKQKAASERKNRARQAACREVEQQHLAAEAEYERRQQ